MSAEQIDKLANELAKHLPCTVAAIADALRKATTPAEKAKTTE